jgi:hypothetical protein
MSGEHRSYENQHRRDLGRTPRSSRRPPVWCRRAPLSSGEMAAVIKISTAVISEKTDVIFENASVMPGGDRGDLGDQSKKRTFDPLLVA